MGKEFDAIDDRLQGWIAKQRMFFVATAPLDENGHVNCSPKGLDSLRVLGPKQLAYVDVGGSGIETVAHIRENQRITIMLCAFDGPPKIFRFYGRGRAVEPGHAEFDELVAQFPEQPTVRNVIVVDVDRIMDSCGYGVPEFDFRKDRESMANWVNSKTEDELIQYRRDNNSESLDGLPGLRFD